MNSTTTTSVAPVSTADICVVIPAFNEEQLIARCVTSVLEAGITAAQIFVVDDCSFDRTREVLDGVAGINVIANPRHVGKIGGIQRAIASHGLATNFRFLSVLDADSHVDPMYYEWVARAFRAHPDAVLVSGAPRSEPANWITAFRALDYAMSDWVYRPGQDALGVIMVAPGCASTYRTSILPSLDWDGGTLVEDMDLTVQVHRKRLGRVLYVREAISHTQDPRRVRDYVGQVTRWYSGAWQVMRLHRLPLGRQRIDLEFGFVAGEGLLYSMFVLLMPLLAIARPHLALRWLLLDQLVVVATALLCALKMRRPDVLFWSPAFVVLRFINCFLWVRTFWTEIVRRHTRAGWFTPQRYGRREPATLLKPSQEMTSA
jgi:cellulose synthase/poly-beta-1,6-N-acetylglucosamine synthase-like glycosyltransferase